MNKVKILTALAAVTVCIISTTTHADPFQKGSQAISIVAGSGSSFNENYIIIGGGYGYYVLDGLELGLDAQAWVNGDPSIYKLSPTVKYVFTQPKTIRPYVGAFFRRTFIDGFEDLDSVGYRAGLYFMGQKNFYFGAGFVYEDYQGCSEVIFKDCSTTYPEILFLFSM